MNRIKLFCLLCIVLTVGACEFNQSVQKDLVTGAVSRGDGIGVGDISIQINGVLEKRNSFVNGEKVNFIFNDITGLTIENGKVFPGISMYIVKNEKDTVAKYPDLLSNLEGGTDIKPLQLQAHFMANLPPEDYKVYMVLIKVWDKKGEGAFRYGLPFSVKKNEVLKIEASEIDYTDIYLWNETEQWTVANKEIDLKNEFILILEGLNGLTVVNNKVFPALSIAITDQDGDQILYGPNVLEAYKTVGVDYDVLKEGQLPVSITFTPGQISNPCQLRATLTDLKSERRIDISAEFELK